MGSVFVCPRLRQRHGAGDSVCVCLCVFVCVCFKKQRENYHAVITLVVSRAFVSMFIYVHMCKSEKQSACIPFLQALSVCVNAMLCVLDTYGLCMTTDTIPALYGN